MNTLLAAMADVEVQVAERARRAGDELLAPRRSAEAPPPRAARGRHREDARREVPEPEQDRTVVGMLGAGQRTPVFRVDAQPFSRYSWYVRLPGPPGGPWAGIVRCEATGALAAATVDRPRRHGHRDAPDVRVRAAQGHPGTAEPVPDRRPRARSPAPTRRRGDLVLALHAASDTPVVSTA